MLLKVCKNCNGINFTEEWINGPLICIKCGFMDFFTIVIGSNDNKEKGNNIISKDMI
jgi:transcription initiation factor TFIIIB Brf1 subunit/transcription initiation factor TFIIB